jgi:hypothetical protein
MIYTYLRHIILFFEPGANRPTKTAGEQVNQKV